MRKPVTAIDTDIHIDPDDVRPELRELLLGGKVSSGRRINLRDLGFIGRVSDGARAEIEANARRAARALQTAHLYWFRAPPTKEVE